MNTEGGSVRLYRRVWDNPIFRSRQKASVFVWMISAALWSETTLNTAYGRVRLFPGEVIIADREVATAHGLAKTTLRRLLQRLAQADMICLDLGRISVRAGPLPLS